MSEQILAVLKRKLDDLASQGLEDPEILRNALKEELQFYVLNFVYHHPEYKHWIMYGGSALRIIYGLDRMSVDLDFEIEHEISRRFLDEFKEEIEEHFSRTYGTDAGFLTTKMVTGRGVLLKFKVGEALSFGHASNQVHLKIDLNHFIASKAATERQPINRGQLSFVIVTYKMSTLMASKVAAIFLRGTRGVGKAFYEEKGRDIYDLLWYMSPERRSVPDLDYLAAKNVKEAKDLRTLFDKLTVKMNAVSHANLRQDLLPLFVNRTYIENWLQNWLETYLRLLEAYKIFTVRRLESVQIRQDFDTDNIYFTYTYLAEEGGFVRIRCGMSDHWMEYREGDLRITIDEDIRNATQIKSDGWNSRQLPEDRLLQYATLFYQKAQDYLNKSNRIMLGTNTVTKLIRLTADHLNPKEQIVLNKSALLSCGLADLLK